MNREIKFRAWDKRINAIREVWVIDYRASKNYEMVQMPSLIAENEAVWGNTQEHLVVTQFTGLKDKNGREIYEGDICKVVDETGHWNVAAQEMNSLDSFHFWNHVAENMENGVVYEVIGNIFENPELLKQ